MAFQCTCGVLTVALTPSCTCGRFTTVGYLLTLFTVSSSLGYCGPPGNRAEIL
uniref:Uncharacterized protein n=1 Tax=Anguilla anguilla TaxID=7936 RepID=A0A0E9RHJ1_ANGAN